MDGILTAYWWVIVIIVLSFLAVFFSFERQKGRESKQVPQDYIAGLRAMIEGDDHNAFVKLKQAVNEDSDNIDAYLRLGDLMRKKGQHQKAVQIHRQLLLRKTLDPETIALIWKSLAIDFTAAKKFNMALDILESLTKESAHKKWAKEKKLEVFEKSAQWEKAYDIGKDIFQTKEQQKKLAVYKHLAGNALYIEKEYHKARLSYKEALHYDEKFAPSYMMIAESYLAESKKEDAADFFKRLAENVPCEAYPAFYKMEQTLFELGHFSEVESIYRNMLRECPNDPDILRSLAVIAEKKGDVQGAIEALNNAINVNPGDIASVAHLAELYVDSGQKQKAVRLLQGIHNDRSSQKHNYSCNYCRNESNKLELFCPACGRVGPYKRL
jgi:lipopolysaccharide biosynthesis regulator YciM